MRISAGNVLDSNYDGTNTKQEEANFKIGYKEMINPMYRIKPQTCVIWWNKEEYADNVK